MASFAPRALAAARGGTRWWAETLIKAGHGHLLVAVTGEKMARVVQGISTA